MSDYGLYVHVPFCETKCGYCDFYSVALRNRDPAPLVGCLVAELQRRAEAASANIRTVFVGGGTPTVLPLAEMIHLFEALGEVLSDHRVAEFTVEANPATLNDARLAVLTSAGVDRLSMGAQSWHAAELAALERLHSPDDIKPGVELARAHGINRLNLDLMFGIGGQTMASWSESLERTISLGVDHISCYGLTYEPGTRLTAQYTAGKITPCDEALEAEMYLYAIDRLAEAGLEQYEISNFARPGERCLHNMIYWRREPYIGIGPSACGLVDDVRYKNVADIAAYVRGIKEAGDAVTESEVVTGALLAGEMLMLQLRLNEGVDLGQVAQRSGIDVAQVLQSSLAKYRHMEMLRLCGEVLSLTLRGRLFADSIISELYSELHLSEHADGGRVSQ
ncbi:MAG: radical SAM family heme chaperone HemW [Phycisphaerae bacterium]